MNKNHNTAKVANINEAKRPKEVDVVAQKKLAINKYVDAGYSLFACEGKDPLKGSKTINTPFDPHLTAGDFPRNYGVALKKTDLVIDVDRRAFPKMLGGRIVRADGKPYKDGDMWRNVPENIVNSLQEEDTWDTLAHFMEDHETSIKELKTYVVKTGGGGYHIYLKKPEDVVFLTKVPQYPGLEFKSRGAYLIGPGSIHPDTGKPYYVRQRDISQAVDAPENILKTLKAPKYQHNTYLGDFTNDPGTIRQAISYLSTVETAMEGDRNNQVMRLARYCYDLGLSPDDCLDLMDEYYNPRCDSQWDYDKLGYHISSSYRNCRDKLGNKNAVADFTLLATDEDEDEWPQDELTRQEEHLATQKWQFKSPGVLEPHDTTNFMAYLATPGSSVHRLFKYNELTSKVEFTRVPPWLGNTRDIPRFDERARVGLYTYIARERHYKASKQVAADAVLSLTQWLYSYHPIKDYLNGLEWDGEERLDGFFPRYTGCMDTPLNRTIGKNLLLAAINRVMHPGCKLDDVVILEGRQGNEKGKFFETLAKGWYEDITIKFSDHEKTVQKLQGGWILELTEIDKYLKRKDDQEELKSFITRRRDKERLAYEHSAEGYPRACVIVGSCNPGKIGYMSDRTGNRRYWPVTTGDMDVQGLKEVIDQLWAEAMHRYRQGEQYWIGTKELLEESKKQQEQRGVTDPLLEILSESLEGYHDDPDAPPLTIKLVASMANTRLEYPNQLEKLYYAMETLGYERRSAKGKTTYFVPSVDKQLEGLL